MSNIDKIIIDYFNKFGFYKLTTIQKNSLGLIFQKKDTLVIAPTGSGKTECSIIPTFCHIIKSKKPKKIKAIYITPLKALNRDIFNRILKYSNSCHLSIAIRHGDTSATIRKSILNSPPDILITTPETLAVLIIQDKMLIALSELEWIIIDEIHELLNNKRGSQLTLTLERLQHNSIYDITRIGLSATIGNISEASKFLVGTKRKCNVIIDNNIRSYDVQTKYIDGLLPDSIDYIIDFIKKNNISFPILLFTNTRSEAEFITTLLKQKSKLNIQLHHGSLSKQIREDAEISLKQNTANIVVCTSSLELGLDINNIDFVMHYGSPRQTLKLIQRIGRSKHNKNSAAQGLIITNNMDDKIESDAILSSIQTNSLEKQNIYEKPLDVLAHHLVGLTIQLGETSLQFAFNLIVKAYPYRNITLDNLVQVLDLLNNNMIITFDRKKNTFRKKYKSFQYYFSNLSTIPDFLKFKVIDIINNKIIGTLDQKFVSNISDHGNIFVLKGVQWRVINIDESLLKINVEQFATAGLTVPYWEGENIPVDYKIANKAGLFRHNSNIDLFKFQYDKTKDYVIADNNTIIIESVLAKNTIILHACFGTKINSAFAAFLSSVISSLSGFIVDSSFDAYRIILSSKVRLHKKQLLDVIYDEYDLKHLITISLIGTHNLNWKVWCIAKKFGILDKKTPYDKKTARFIYERYSKTILVQESIRELLYDKFDLLALKYLLTKLQNKEIKLIWIPLNDFSKLSKPILNRTTRYYSSPVAIDKSIIELVKARLFKNKHRLICIRCGLWQKIITTNDAKTIKCPYCKSKQITATFYSDYDLLKIIHKKNNGKKISDDENNKFNKAWKISSLIETFGQTALLVLSGYGIGADTAARILRNMIDLDMLYQQIYQAEKQYVITRGFWN